MVRRRWSEEVRLRADALTARLLYGDEPAIDLELAMNALHDEVERRRPDRLWLFEAIYEARWRRLRDQGWARERPAF